MFLVFLAYGGGALFRPPRQRRWRLEHYFGKDRSLIGSSWILL
jgi:hypothetical protein